MMKKIITGMLSGAALSMVFSTIALAQSADSFESGVRNNEGWNFLNAARNFDSYFDQTVGCTEVEAKSFQCVDARLESALNFINAGKVEEGRTRINEARVLSSAMNYGSLYARSYQYEALADLWSGKASSEISGSTSNSRSIRQRIRNGALSFDGKSGSLDISEKLILSGGTITLSPSVAGQISPSFDTGPISNSANDIGAAYGRFSTTIGQQLAIQDAQSYLIEAFSFKKAGQSSSAIVSLDKAIDSLANPRGPGNTEDDPISTERAPFLWSMLRSEKAQLDFDRAESINQKRQVASDFESDVLDDIFGSGYQNARLRGLMWLKLAKMRSESEEFVRCGGGTCGIEAFSNGANIISADLNNPTVDGNWTDPMLDAVYENRGDIANWEQQFYDVIQIAARSEVAADAAEAVIRLKEDTSSTLGQSLRQIDLAEFAFRDADRELEVIRARRQAGAEVPDDVFNIKQDQVIALSNQLNQLKSDFSNSSEGKRFAQLVSSSVDLKTIQNSLDADEAYARTILGEEKGYLILITANELNISQIDRSRGEIRNVVEDLRCSVDFINVEKGFACAQRNKGNPNYQAAFPAFDVKTSASLFDDVFGPVKSRLMSGDLKHLIVQPDAVLAPLPFAAMVTNDPNTLNESSITHQAVSSGKWNHDYTKVGWLSDVVALSHSVGELSFVQARAGNRSGNTIRAPKPFIGFSGFSQYDEQSSAKVTLAHNPDTPTCSKVYKSLGDIAAATNLQAEVVQKQLGGELFKNSEFTDTNILNKASSESGGLKDYRIVMFATHAVAPSPLAKGCLKEPILTTNVDIGDPQSDGILSASDIASGLELSADMVVLSACETAVGSSVSTFSDKPTAETFDGIVRAFYFAQARSLLASHWSVPADQTTSLFEVLFEKEGLAETPFSERLRQTQNTLRSKTYNGNSLSHPVFWANFVFVGDGRQKLEL